jgi:DNA-binding GntR family transcriptional regulator
MSKSRKHHIQSKKQKRIARTITRHHVRPKSRGGSANPHNLMALTWERHQALHKCFGNRTIEEILDLLLHWCHYRYIFMGEYDKEQLYQHFVKRFNRTE